MPASSQSAVLSPGSSYAPPQTSRAIGPSLCPTYLFLLLEGLSFVWTCWFFLGGLGRGLELFRDPKQRLPLEVQGPRLLARSFPFPELPAKPWPQSAG